MNERLFLAEAYVLIFTDTSCSQAIRVWFMLKLANDLVGLILEIVELLRFRQDLETAKKQSDYTQFLVERQYADMLTNPELRKKAMTLRPEGLIKGTKALLPLRCLCLSSFGFTQIAVSPRIVSGRVVAMVRNPSSPSI